MSPSHESQQDLQRHPLGAPNSFLLLVLQGHLRKPWLCPVKPCSFSHKFWEIYRYCVIDLIFFSAEIRSYRAKPCKKPPTAQYFFLHTSVSRVSIRRLCLGGLPPHGSWDLWNWRKVSVVVTMGKYRENQYRLIDIINRGVYTLWRTNIALENHHV